MKKVQILITIFAIVIAIIHIIWPNLAIDAITLTLLIIALIPWLAPLFKSLELPGGWKVEFRDLEIAKDKIERAGLLSKEVELSDLSKFSFQIVADEDPNLALAGLRIEIEKRLINIAESRDIKINNKGMRQILTILSQNNILTIEEKNVIIELVGLLNKAVHGAEVDYRAAKWAMETGPRILYALDEKLKT